jgi:predicted dehydrogenase
MTQRKIIRFGIIGLGLMGREFSSSVARWCHLLCDSGIPEITAICSDNKESWEWYLDNFPSIEMATLDYKDLLANDNVDVIYCAVPHNLHQQMYIDIINSGKHLLGEKPFGIDLAANDAILKAVKANPNVFVRCNSEFPYFPGALRLIKWLQDKKYGRLMEVRAGFHHSSDMDLKKPINWKRQVEINGEYGCMGDLGLHVQHIPFRMGWKPNWVTADLLNIADTRPDGKGNTVPSETWDNATITTRCIDPANNKEFSLVFETKRMSPGCTNTWFIEVYGTEGSARFTTHDPKAFWYLDSTGKEQGWTRIDLGAQSAILSITGGIFEFGFSDAFQQMIGAFILELDGKAANHPFTCATPEETNLSHKVFTAALESFKSGKRIYLS